MEQTTEQPPRSLLEKLPVHLFFLICEYLAQLQPRTRRSVFDLSLTSKTCSEATDPERFRHIHFFIVGPQKLQRDADHWRRILQTGQRLRFVRSVKISGKTISPSTEKKLLKKGDISGSTLPVIQYEKLHDNWRRNGDAEDEVPELFSGLDKPTNPNFLLPLPSTAWPDESAWKPLVDLIGDLPALQDVVFACGDQFPRLLLTELHEHHPHCRLHMHRFKLRSLILPELAEQQMHPDDIALATSPCLHSIVVQTQPYDDAQTLDYNMEAVMSMVKGAAPNLKNVSVTEGVHQSAPGSFSTIPRPPWKGFQISSAMLQEQKSSMGSLENLVLSYSTSSEKLLQWSCCTDFRHLRSITARSCFEFPGVRKLAEIARQTPMRALSSLHLRMRASTDETNALVDPAVAELLKSLCPLESIELEGPVREKSWEAIRTHHAERLVEVAIECHDIKTELFHVSPERVARLSRECPRLKKVDVREPILLEPSGMYDLSDWI